MGRHIAFFGVFDFMEKIKSVPFQITLYLFQIHPGFIFALLAVYKVVCVNVLKETVQSRY